MFFSKEQIQQSVKRLNDLNPFFGTTFLAFKLQNLPIGKTKSINSTATLDAFLHNYYHPIDDYPGFYTPFKTWDNKKKRWNSPLYASSLHVTASQHFKDVLFLAKEIKRQGFDNVHHSIWEEYRKHHKN